jgi:hypothetical protein
VDRRSAARVCSFELVQRLLNRPSIIFIFAGCSEPNRAELPRGACRTLFDIVIEREGIRGRRVFGRGAYVPGSGACRMRYSDAVFGSLAEELAGGLETVSCSKEDAFVQGRTLIDWLGLRAWLVRLT